MAEGARPAIGVPAGLPVGWIAPESAVMDVWDLAEMRDALREGKTVTVASDGHVYVSAEPTGPPMTDATETFIESKLGEVRRFVLTDGGMTIRPDGRMSGDFAGHRMKFELDQDRALGADDLSLIHSAIAAGASVGILPDGSVHYLLLPGAQAPDPVSAKRIIDFFDEEVSSGNIARALAEGRAVRLIGYTVDEVPAPAPAEGFPFPEPGHEEDPAAGAEPPAPESVDVDSLTDPAAMHRLAGELEARAESLRNDVARRLGSETSSLGISRDSHARKEWGANQEAAAAKQQVTRETRLQAEERVTIDRLESQARTLEAKGDAAGAAELREEARIHLDREAAAGDRARAADAERVALETEAKEHGRQVREIEAQLAKLNEDVQSAEPALDAIERRAVMVEGAATQFAEADRLDREAVKARADGDTVAADDIQRAADFVRRQGRDALRQADDLTIDTGAIGAATGRPAEVPAAAGPVSVAPSSVGDEVLADTGALADTSALADTTGLVDTTGLADAPEPAAAVAPDDVSVDAIVADDLVTDDAWSITDDVAAIDAATEALAVPEPTFDSADDTALAPVDIDPPEVVEPEPSFGDLA